MAFKTSDYRASQNRWSGLKTALADRPRMLRLGLLWVSRLLMAEGAVTLLSVTLFPNLSFLRNHPLTFPPQAALGPALLALGYFSAISIEDARRQHRIVDALILLLSGRLIALFWNLSQVPEIFWMERIFLSLTAAAALWLVYYRVRASELQGDPEAPVDAKVFWKQCLAKAKGLLSRFRPKKF